MVGWRSWASVRTTFVVIGAGFVFASLGAACLDYAGEELFPRCAPRETGQPSRTASPEQVPLEQQPDCGAPAPANTGTGSGS